MAGRVCPVTCAEDGKFAWLFASRWADIKHRRDRALLASSRWRPPEITPAAVCLVGMRARNDEIGEALASGYP
jgi:hypothetical protein